MAAEHQSLIACSAICISFMLFLNCFNVLDVTSCSNKNKDNASCARQLLLKNLMMMMMMMILRTAQLAHSK